MEIVEDVLAARSIMEMADLGRFDVALTAYGCACLEAGHVRYFVSAHAQMVHDYIRRSQLAQALPTDICCQIRYIPDHAGTVYAEERKLKFDLALKLQQDYPQTDLTVLAELAQTAHNDAAYPLLAAWQQDLIGLFSADQLLLFKETLQETFIAKKLTAAHYTTLLHWVEDQLRQVENEILLPGEGKKTFWGFAALTPDGQPQEYAINANYPAIMQRRSQLAAQGLLVSPLWQKTLPLPPKCAPYMLRQPFTQQLKTCLNSSYLTLLTQIYQLPSPIAPEDYVQAASCLTSSETRKLHQVYGHLWGLV